MLIFRHIQVEGAISVAHPLSTHHRGRAGIGHRTALEADLGDLAGETVELAFEAGGGQGARQDLHFLVRHESRHADRAAAAHGAAARGTIAPFLSDDALSPLFAALVEAVEEAERELEAAAERVKRDQVATLFSPRSVLHDKSDALRLAVRGELTTYVTDKASPPRALTVLVAFRYDGGRTVVTTLKDRVAKLRELSPLWDMYKDGIDISTIQWAAH
mgnify:CR=1 FL=1